MNERYCKLEIFIPESHLEIQVGLTFPHFSGNQVKGDVWIQIVDHHLKCGISD